MIIRQELDEKTRLTLMALKTYQTRTLLTVLQRQYKERSIIEDKFRKDFIRLVSDYEEKVLSTYTSAVENGTPNHNISVLLQISNTDFKERYQKLIYKHFLLVEKNARNQTDELIKLQKRKQLGQKKEQVSFKELPITWLSTKAKDIQSKLSSFIPTKPKKPYIIKENKPVKKYLRTQAITTSQHTAQRIDKDINKILTLSETEGTNSRGVAKHLTRKFKDLKTWEAERIARTEINHANNAVTHNRLLESGLVDYKQWITAQDHRVRGLKKKDKANHVIMNGEIARIGEPFSNGLQYPGDKTGRPEEFINCRCTLIPYIPDYDMIAPTDKTTWHEEDMQRLPTNKGQQITLQLQENMKLYEVMNGYMKLYPDTITLKPSKIQTTLDSIITPNKTTLDKILQPIETKTTIQIEESEPKPLEERTFKQLDKHLTTQLTKLQKAETRYEKRKQRIYKSLDKISDKLTKINNENNKKVQKYLQENYETLMSNVLSSAEQKKYNKIIKILEKEGVNLENLTEEILLEKSSLGIVEMTDFIELMEKAQLKPKEQSDYNKLLKQVTQAGIKITQNTIDISLIKPAKLGFKGSRKFKKLHEKLSSGGGLPEEYTNIIKQIEQIKQDPNLYESEKLSKIKKLEIEKKIFIKKNTPKEIRDEVTKQIKQKTQKQVDKLESKKKILQDKIYGNVKHSNELKKAETKINQLREPWRIKAQQKYKTPSEFITHTKIAGSNYYGETLKDEVLHTKYSIFENADTTKFDKITEFYTDNSTYFNKYVNLKRQGATTRELKEVIKLEWEKEIWDSDNNTFKTDIKNKYKNIKSQKQLQDLFEEMETKLLNKAKPLKEKVVTFSAQNMEHYKNLQVGDKLPDTGFISSTLDKDQSITFAQIQMEKDHDVALIEFHFEEGVDVIPILQSAINEPGKNYTNEREVIVTPDVEMVIEKKFIDKEYLDNWNEEATHFVVKVRRKRL